VLFSPYLFYHVENIPGRSPASRVARCAVNTIALFFLAASPFRAKRGVSEKQDLKIGHNRGSLLLDFTKNLRKNI